MAKLTIRSVTARGVLAPLPRPLRTASGAIPAAPLVLVDVDTDQGVPGRAYVFGYSPVTVRALCTFLHDMAELVVGEPVAPTARAAQLTAAFRLLGRQGLVGMALSGLDMALWDALGRHHDRPVVRDGDERRGDRGIEVAPVDAAMRVRRDRATGLYRGTIHDRAPSAQREPGSLTYVDER